MANTPEPSFAAAFWRTLKKIDKGKLNTWPLAARNAVAVALPLAIAIQMNHPLAGVAISTGALNVAYSDGHDPYAQRARRMLTWSLVGAIAIFLGSVSGTHSALAVLVATGWAFAAGLLVSISPRAGDLGLNTLVTIIVYSARGALDPKGALYAGLLGLGGGLLQTALALLAWPLERYGPERRAIGGVYLALAREVDPASETDLSPALQQPAADVQDAFSALGRDRSTEGERSRLLLDQTDRLRLSAYHVARLRPELVDGARCQPGQPPLSDVLDRLLQLASNLLAAIGEELTSGRFSENDQELVDRLNALVHSTQACKQDDASVAAREFAAAADVLAGQLRLVYQVAHHATPAGATDFDQQQHASPLKLQLRSWASTLSANLNLGSTACRHAIRLSVCVMVADLIARDLSWLRTYWLPMTVAVVLKPDFTTTISRGVLRLAGTFGGLFLATILLHLLPQSGYTQLFLVGILTFFLRYVGPGNYGIFSISISGLIVFLVAVTGVPAAEVIAERAQNTLAGGIFALLAYMLWPTFERRHVSDTIAQMIEATRDYFRAVFARFTRDEFDVEEALDQARARWRRTRSEAEASVDRVASEPGARNDQLNLLNSILASSHALVYSIIELEAGVIHQEPHPVPPALEAFVHDVDFTLYFVAAALRGSRAAAGTLPQLREDHRRLLDARDQFPAADEYIIQETDLLTVNLNTLREQVMRYAS